MAKLCKHLDTKYLHTANKWQFYGLSLKTTYKHLSALQVKICWTSIILAMHILGGGGQLKFDIIYVVTPYSITSSGNVSIQVQPVRYQSQPGHNPPGSKCHTWTQA